jgi:hypothetical protein
MNRLMFNGAYNFSSRMSFKLFNLIERMMLLKIRLSVMKIGMIALGVNIAYASEMANTKNGKYHLIFNRHRLAGFVTARRALGYG